MLITYKLDKSWSPTNLTNPDHPQAWNNHNQATHASSLCPIKEFTELHFRVQIPSLSPATDLTTCSSLTNLRNAAHPQAWNNHHQQTHASTLWDIKEFTELQFRVQKFHFGNADLADPCKEVLKHSWNHAPILAWHFVEIVNISKHCMCFSTSSLEKNNIHITNMPIKPNSQS